MRSTFNPYTYDSTMRYFYNGGPTPQDVAKVRASAPERLQHLNSVWQFTQWFAENMPEAYNRVQKTRPDMLDPASVVLSGSLGPTTPAAKKAGMSGMGDALATEPPAASDSPITSWGTQLLDFAKGALAVNQQRKLLETNLALAEKGLPPIDPGSIAPTVNVGVSQDVQKLAIIGVGGVVAVGLALALSRRRK